MTRIPERDGHAVRSLFLSYAVVFMVPLSLLFGVFLIARGQLVRGESERAMLDLSGGVQELQYTLDGYFERAQAIALSVVQDEELLSALRSGDSIGRLGDPRAFRLASHLRSLAVSNDFISDIIVQITRDGVCVGPDGCLPRDAIPIAGLGRDEWLAVAGGFTLGRTLCDGDGRLYFLRSLPVSPMGEPNRCMVMIAFKARILADLAEPAGQEPGFAILDDEDGKNLSSPFRNVDLSAGIAALGEERGQGSTGGWLFAYSKSTRLPITYVRVAPEGPVRRKQRNLGGWAACAFLLLAAAGSLLILHFARRSLDPLRQLIAAAKGEKPGALSLIDPYSEIRTMLLDAATRKLAYEELHSREDERGRQRAFIEALADRDAEPTALDSRARELGLDLAKGEYCLARLECRGGSGIAGKASELSPIRLCEGVLRGVLSESSGVTSARYDSYLLFALTRDAAKTGDWNQALALLLEKAQAFLRESYGIETLAALSRTHSGLAELHEAFEELGAAMEYLELKGGESFVRYSRIPPRGSGAWAARPKREARLIGLVKAGDFGKAKSCLNEIVEADFRGETEDVQTLRFRLYALVANVVSAISCAQAPEGRSLMGRVESYGKVYRCDTVAEFQAELNGLFDELERLGREAEESSRDTFRDEVVGIVDENYMNPDLSVCMIADMMGRNLDSLSRSFSKATGLGPLDYIHGVRVREAKLLMEKDGELTIQRIASMVGYSTCESFIRAFKRVEGITPGRYKATLSRVRKAHG